MTETKYFLGNGLTWDFNSVRDWGQAKPDAPAVERALSALVVKAIPTDDPAITEYAGLLKGMHAGGDFIVRCFVVKADPVIDWYARRGLFNEIDFFNRFINHPRVLASLPARLSINDIGAETFQFHYDYWAHIDRVLYQRALFGGAYVTYKGSRQQLMGLVDRVCHAMFESRHHDFRLYKGQSCWSPWFQGPVDGSMILIDVKTARVWLVLYTDVD